MHLTRLTFQPENFPTRGAYPFNLEIFHSTGEIGFKTPVTFFIGENGTGKSTLLRAIAQKCAIPVWKETDRQQLHVNPYADQLYRWIELEWANGSVPGSFFGSEIFQTFAQVLDEWAVADPEMLKYFGGESLVTKSHGQCNMSYFKSRYQIKGLYLLDEPETALSPKKQLELLKILNEMSRAGHAQFIVATHSPILLALPEADIYSFDNIPLKRVQYEETDYYRIYKDFLEDRGKYLKQI
jgi:predicted ATPase